MRPSHSRVEWIEDEGLMLHGSLIVNAAGEFAGLVPNSKGNRHPRRIVDQRRVLIVDEKGKAPGEEGLADAQSHFAA